MSTNNGQSTSSGPHYDALTPASTVTLPEKCALSSTTTACDPSDDRTPRTSKDSDTRNALNPFETDIEAMDMEVIDSQKPCVSRQGLCTRKSDTQVWPSKDQWKQKAKNAKMKRSCTPLAGLSKRNKIIAKILIVLLIVGIAVGVGFGVSKPLGAPIWGDND